jgi:hypothetical protein
LPRPTYLREDPAARTRSGEPPHTSERWDDADHAYELLKAHSQKTGLKLSEVAKSITESHTFLPAEPS